MSGLLALGETTRGLCPSQDFAQIPGRSSAHFPTRLGKGRLVPLQPLVDGGACDAQLDGYLGDADHDGVAHDCERRSDALSVANDPTFCQERLDRTVGKVYTEHMTRTQIIKGRKYDKLVAIDGAGYRSALAFQDKATGRWFEAASWTQPTRRLMDVSRYGVSAS